MPKRRHVVKMTAEDCWRFIEQSRDLHVATLDADGCPHLTTLWFAVVDGAIVFESFSKAQKILNLRRDPRIAVLVADGDDYANLRGVSIRGRAELVDDPERVHRLADRIALRNGNALPEGARANLAPKRTAVIVRPEKFASWDHRKLGGTY